MKKLKFLAVAAVLLGCTVFAQTAQAQETKYYVVSGFMIKGKTSRPDAVRPYVTNVVRVSCKDIDSQDVESQFEDFFNAYVKRYTGGYEFVRHDTFYRVIAHSFDSADKAEKKRRELIADYNKKNYDDDTYIVKDFSVECDD